MLLFRTVYRNKLLCGILDPLFFFVEFDFSKTLLSLVLGPAGVTLVLVNPSAFSFLTLSDKFAAATAANQRILLLAVGEVVPVSSLWHGSGAISGGLQSGHFRCGLPYNRAGHGPRPLVVFSGIDVREQATVRDAFNIQVLAEGLHTLQCVSQAGDAARLHLT